MTSVSQATAMAAAAASGQTGGGAPQIPITPEMKELQETYLRLGNEIKDLSNSFSNYHQQLSESKIVEEELSLCNEEDKLYKQVGPLLIGKELDEAKESVEARIKFITDKLEGAKKDMSFKQKQQSDKQKEYMRLRKVQVETLQKAVAAAQKDAGAGAGGEGGTEAEGKQ